MNFKRIVFPLLSVFLVFRSLEILKIYAARQPESISTGESLFYALLLNLFITGVFAFIGFAYPTSKLLPSVYYTVRYPRFMQRLAKAIGMTFFRVGLLKVFWGSEKNRKKYFNGTKQGIRNFDFQTRQSEFGHLAAFIPLLGVAVYMLAKGHVISSLITSVVNFIGNFYPIILQRLHRIQIARMTNHRGWNTTTPEKPTV